MYTKYTMQLFRYAKVNQGKLLVSFFFSPTLMITNISFSLTGDKSTIVVTPSLTDFKGLNMYISDYNVLKFFKVSQGIITK